MLGSIFREKTIEDPSPYTLFGANESTTSESITYAFAICILDMVCLQKQETQVNLCRHKIPKVAPHLHSVSKGKAIHI